MMNAAPGSGDVYLKVTGADSYVEIASIADYGIPTTGALSVAAWMRPDTLNFSHWEETGYVYWIGKGDSGQQEWAFRMTIEITRPKILRAQTGAVCMYSIPTAD